MNLRLFCMTHHGVEIHNISNVVIGASETLDRTRFTFIDGIGDHITINPLNGRANILKNFITEAATGKASIILLSMINGRLRMFSGEELTRSKPVIRDFLHSHPGAPTPR